MSFAVFQKLAEKKVKSTAMPKTYMEFISVLEATRMESGFTGNFKLAHQVFAFELSDAIGERAFRDYKGGEFEAELARDDAESDFFDWLRAQTLSAAA